MTVVLTAEVQVDRSGHLSILVLGFDFVKAGIFFFYIIQDKLDFVEVLCPGLDVDDNALAFFDVHVSSVPVNLGLGAGQKLAVEYQLVAIVFLTEFGLLGEARGEILPRGPHDGLWSRRFNTRT